MSRRSVEKKTADLSALRSRPAAEAEPQLRLLLRDRSSYVVSKAAPVAAELALTALVPDLLAAFERFFGDPVKTDPQCWAKNALSRALRDLGHQDPAVFLRGTAHVQLEPVWGGRADTAATLRGTCALALVACRLDSLSILTRLADLLADPESPVRIDAARAIAQLAAIEGIPPLRLKALLGDAEPAVTGQCLASLLSLSPRGSLPFVAGFLTRGQPELRLEAAAALAASSEPESIAILKNYFDQEARVDVKRTLIGVLAGSPLPDAAELLLSILQNASATLAAEAIAALANSRHRRELEPRAAAIMKSRADSTLAASFAKAFGIS